MPNSDGVGRSLGFPIVGASFQNGANLARRLHPGRYDNIQSMAEIIPGIVGIQGLLMDDRDPRCIMEILRDRPPAA